MRALVLTAVLFSVPALAGGRHGGGISFVPSRPFVNFYVSNPPAYPYVVYPYFTYWYTVPQAPPPPPPAPPTVVYVEREPAPPPQVIVVPQPAPVIVEVPAPPPPVPAAPPPPPPAPVVTAPVGPRVPGPDVFAWTDEDGVVNYSTRVPASAQAKAKKLAPLAK